jgi:hypothetical protein
MGSSTTGTWELILRGRSDDVRLARRGEDIDALHFDIPTCDFVLSTTGSFRVPGVGEGEDDDLLAFAATQYGETTTGAFTFVFDGALYDLDPEDIDGLFVID